MESKFQPPTPPSSAPTLRSGTPQYLSGLGFTVPVMVMSSRGTSPACRGSSKGTFWETTDIWCQQKPSQKPNATPGDSQPQALPLAKQNQPLRTQIIIMMEPLPLEGLVLPEEQLVLPVELLVLPEEQKTQIQGHWMVVLGQEMALLLVELQGMPQVLLDTLLVLLGLQDKLQVLQGGMQGMLQVLEDRFLVLQDRLQVLEDRFQVLQDRFQVLQDRLPVLQDTLGRLQELQVGSPRRASPGLGGHRGLGCCCWPRHQIAVDRGEDKVSSGTFLLGSP